MKRFVSLIALVVVSFSFSTAHAEWIQKEIQWRKSYVGGASGTSIVIRDTLYAPYPFATSGTADTTADFKLSDCYPWRDGHSGAATTVDTVYFAYVVVQQDSAAAGTPTVSSVTYEIDGRAGGFGGAVNLARYTQIDSTVATFVNSSGVYSFVPSLPIRAISGLGGVGSNGPENALNFAYRIMAFDALRVRISAVTGVMSGSLRVFLRYWKPEHN